METEYVCVESGTALHQSGDGKWLVSSDSAKSYPIIEGIPVLVRRPEGLLHAFSQALDDARSSFEQEKELLNGKIHATYRKGARQRIERVQRAKECNISLLEKYMQPIRAHLARRERVFDALDMLATTISRRTPSWWMLSYFHQDWGNTRAFPEVAALFGDALRRWAPDKDRLVMLGTGAAGLVRECAKDFDHAYGVDLSVPCLLLANAMFQGRSLQMYLERADWAQVTLQDREIKRHVKFVAADVNWLPFSTSSVSVVLTQYLMDVLGDPLHVAREIRRILKPGGVWVNFSNPFPLPDEPDVIGRPCVDELADILHPFGWAMEQCERRQFSYLNTDDISTCGNRSIQDVHFFVARKQLHPVVTDAAKPGAPEFDWDSAPKRSLCREVHFAHKRVPRDNGKVDTVLEAQIPKGGSLLLSPQAMAFFEQIMSSIDGHRTIRDILDQIPLQNRLTDDDGFLRLFQYLVRHHGLLST